MRWWILSSGGEPLKSATAMGGGCGQIGSLRPHPYPPALRRLVLVLPCSSTVVVCGRGNVPMSSAELPVPTTCPFCSCGCGQYLLTDRGKLAGVAPSEAHPVSGGKLCARGWHAHEAPVWGKRLRQPLIKRQGTPEPTSWAEALDYVSLRLRDLVQTGGAVGVLGSPRASNEENYLAAKLARTALETNNVDFCYHSLSGPLLSGIEEVCGDYAPTIHLKDIEKAEAVLLFEGDLAQTHPRAASAVMKAVEGGAKLVTIGCVGTQMARLAAMRLVALPGSEGAVLDGLLAAALHLGAAGEAIGHASAGGAVELWPRLEAVTVTEEMRQASEWLAGARRAAFLMPPLGGGGRATRSAARALATLAAITGHLGRAGSGLLPLLARSNARGALDMGVAPDRLPGYQPVFDQGARLRLEELWGKRLPGASGLDAARLLEAANGLIVVADDPATVLPMGQRARAALERIAFLVVLDAFETPLARIAHVVLPIACFAETEGTVTNMEGMVQGLHAAAAPPGEARPGWQALAELGARFAAGGEYRSAADVLREIGEAAPRYAGLHPQPPEDAWSEQWTKQAVRERFMLGAAGMAPPACPDRRFVLASDGDYDWSRDPLVSFSPALSRDSQSLEKLFPKGLVGISRQDADELGIRPGQMAKLTSEHGEAVLPIRVRAELARGVLLAPRAFREQVGAVLGPEDAVPVKAEAV